MMFRTALQFTARLSLSLFVLGLGYGILAPLLFSAASNLLVILGFFTLFATPFAVWAVWKITFRSNPVIKELNLDA